MEWFLNISPDFKDEFDYEVISNGLAKSVKVNLEKKPITDIAEIDKKNGIQLFENFNQFLWCCSYTMFVVFDEGIQKPTLNGLYKGELDMENPYVRRALELFNQALSLFESYNESAYHHLPNPEKYNEFEKFYIERTSGIYTSAMVFILLHEFGHQYYGHLDYYPSEEEEKLDEFTADDFAFDKMSKHFHTKRGTTYKFGIIIGISSLIYQDKTLTGGNTHPDPDSRLVKLMEQMDLDELNNLWGVASLTFKLWMIHYGKDEPKMEVYENYKEMFYSTLKKVNEIKWQ